MKFAEKESLLLVQIFLNVFLNDFLKKNWTFSAVLAGRGLPRFFCEVYHEFFLIHELVQ